MAGADTIERLQLFLRELSPQARSMLIAEFERTLLRGEELGDADLVLQELRRLARDQREGAPRVGHSARLFSNRSNRSLSTISASIAISAASRARRSTCCGRGSAATFSRMTRRPSKKS